MANSRQDESESTDACYIFTPTGITANGARPSKKRKIANSSRRTANIKLPALLGGREDEQLSKRRLDTYTQLWEVQEKKLKTVLKDANSETVHNVCQFLDRDPDQDDAYAVPAGFITAGLATSSSGSIFSALEDLLKQDQRSIILNLAPAQCTNLKTALKSIIVEATQLSVDDDENEDLLQASQGIRLLNYDLQTLYDLVLQKSLKQCILFFQDSEALDGGVLSDLIDVVSSWSDRIPFTFLFEIATSIDLFQEKLSRQAINQLSGTSFETKSSSEILDILFKCATYPDKAQLLWLGAGASKLLLDRQTEDVQSAKGFISAMKYMYMTHFFSNPLSVLVPGDKNINLKKEHLTAIRSLPSFKRWIQDLLDERENRKASQLTKDDAYLIKNLGDLLNETRESLRTMFHALEVLQTIYAFAPSKSNLTWSALYIKAMTGDLSQSTVIRELSLSVKRLPSDVMLNLLEALEPAPGLTLNEARTKLISLIRAHATSGPFRSEHDTNRSTLRTTVVAQKVSLSKHKATLSTEDAEYSKIVNHIDLALREFLTQNIVSPKELVLHEVFVFDSKSTCRDALGPSPRQALERALASPHDYLACECCEGEEGLKASQPATAIVYQLCLESGTLINVADLWAAYRAIIDPQSAEDGDDESDEQTDLALFYRALAELRYLGIIKSSRKKADHIMKLRWKGI